MSRSLRRWVGAMWLALSGCEGGQPALPERFGSPEARANGRRLFVEHCALCHGERADGRGKRRSALSGPPANFRDPSWPSRTPPRKTFEIIGSGVRGTSMPAWKVLDDDEKWDLVSYLHSVSREDREPTP